MTEESSERKKFRRRSSSSERCQSTESIHGLTSLTAFITVNGSL